MNKTCLRGPWCRALCLASLLGSGVLAHAGEVAIRAEMLVEQALEHNASLRARGHALAAAAQRPQIDAALADPVVSYALAPDSVGRADIATGQIYSVSQSLPWPGRRALLRERARQGAAEAADALAWEQLSVAREVRAAFAEWSHRHAAAMATAAQETQLLALAEVAERRYAAGLGTQQDVLAVQVRLRRLRQSRWELEAGAGASQAHLVALSGAGGRLEGREPAALAAVGQLPALADMQAAMVSNHPALARLDAAIAAARADLELAMLASRPDLRISATHVGTLPREAYRNQIGISVELPLASGRRSAARRMAQAQLDEMLARRTDLERRLTARMRAARARWLAAEKSRQLQLRELIPLASQSRESALALYHHGDGGIQAVIDADVEVLAVQIEHLRSVRDNYLARTELAELSAGQFDPVLVTEQTP